MVITLNSEENASARELLLPPAFPTEPRIGVSPILDRRILSQCFRDRGCICGGDLRALAEQERPVGLQVRGLRGLFSYFF